MNLAELIKGDLLKLKDLVTAVTLVTVNMIQSQVSILPSHCHAKSRVSQREEICAIILQKSRKYPSSSENQNSGEFTAEKKRLLQEETPISARDLQGR